MSCKMKKSLEINRIESLNIYFFVRELNVLRTVMLRDSVKTQRTSLLIWLYNYLYVKFS